MPAGTRAEVRGAIEAFFNARIGQGGSIPAIGQVFGFPEKIMAESDMFQDFLPGMEEGAFLFIHLMRSSDLRIALGGPTNGQKWIDYECTLTTVFRSASQKSSDAGLANEAMIDAIVTAIRSDREAGAAGTVFQWGEGTRTGGTDIEVESFYPQALHGRQGATQILTTFKVKVAQIINA